VACGKGLAEVELGGTFAVSFLGAGLRGAGPMELAGAAGGACLTGSGADGADGAEGDLGGVMEEAGGAGGLGKEVPGEGGAGGAGGLGSELPDGGVPPGTIGAGLGGKLSIADSRGFAVAG